MLLLAQGPSSPAAPRGSAGLLRTPPLQPGLEPLQGSQRRGTGGRDHPTRLPAAFTGSGGQGRREGGLAVATLGHGSSHRDGAAGRTAVPSWSKDGWRQGQKDFSFCG